MSSTCYYWYSHAHRGTFASHSFQIKWFNLHGFVYVCVCIVWFFWTHTIKSAGQYDIAAFNSSIFRDRWINNTEKMKMMRRKKERYVITDYFQFSSHYVCISFYRWSLLQTKPAEDISRQDEKVHIFFFGNFPGQKRSFFSTLSSTASCVSVLFFVLSSLLCATTRKITYSLYVLFLLLWSEWICAEYACNTRSQRIVLVSMLGLIVFEFWVWFSFILLSPSLLAMPSLHQCRWHNSLRDVKIVCSTLLRENQRATETITDDLRFRVSHFKDDFHQFRVFITPFRLFYGRLFPKESFIRLNEKEAVFLLSTYLC